MEINKLYNTLSGLGYKSQFKISDNKLYIVSNYLENLYEHYLQVRNLDDSIKIYFKNDLNIELFNHKKSYLSYNFNNCVFESKIKLNGSYNELSINQTIFEFPILFTKCEFINGLEISYKNLISFHFIHCEFRNDVVFSNVSFEKELYIYDCICHSKLQITKMSSESLTISRTSIEGLFHVMHISLSSNFPIKFDGTLIKTGIDIAEMGLGNKISLFGFEVVENLLMKQFKVKLSKLNEISKHEYGENILYTKESFRILKSELKSQNNNIDALVFERLEKLIHRKELQFNFYFEKGIHKLPPLFDIILIWFGEISNKNGISFMRALAFICLIAVFATGINLYIYYLNGHLIADFSSDGKVYVFKYFLSFFNLTNWSSNSLELKEYWDILFITFVSKIFITIGIYQFIQAARKWSSK